jgi:hypothetical protein
MDCPEPVLRSSPDWSRDSSVLLITGRNIGPSAAPTSLAPQSSAIRLSPVSIESILSGRMEKRIPIAIVVRLTPAQDRPASEPELTYTDNVSAHGARVVSSRSWQIGEVAQVTSLKDEITIIGKVAYCQMLPDNRYFIGLNFKDRRVTWSAYRAYNGT